MLSQLLVGADNRGFVVPKTHGIVFPWTPPLFGIPIDILKQLENMLIEKLVAVTGAAICQRRVARSSRQSSPGSQSSDESSKFWNVKSLSSVQ
jgi:hypothetical protein